MGVTKIMMDNPFCVSSNVSILSVYGYEKYYMTVNIIDMELIMDSLEIYSGVFNRPNAKLGIIVR